VIAVKSLLLRGGLLALIAAAIIEPVSPAGAAVNSGPAWLMTVRATPTVFPRMGEAALPEGQERLQEYVIVATNVGGGSTSGRVTVTDTLPTDVSVAPGLAVAELVNRAGSDEGSVRYPCQFSGQIVTCEAPENVPAGESMLVFVPVNVSPSAPDQLTDSATVVGGGAPEQTATTTTEVGSQVPPFGLLPGRAGFGAEFGAADGSPENRAGSHPSQMTFTFGYPSYVPPSGELYGVGEPKTINLSLPRGLYVNPNSVGKKCTESELETDLSGEAGCPLASQVGLVLTMSRTIGQRPAFFNTKELYEMATAPGHPAEFAFDAEIGLYVHLFGHVNAASEYELSSEVPDIPSKQPLLASVVTFWGSPTDASHDEMRGQGNIGTGGCIGAIPIRACPTERRDTPLLTLPSDCTSGSLSLTGEVASWQDPGVFDRRTIPATDLEGNPVSIAGCNALGFSPTISAQPTTNVGDSPSGLDFDLHQPQSESYEGLATANLKDATVTLPPGFVINPSSANGLGACTAGQIGLVSPVGQASSIRFSEAPQTCPDAAKLGTVKVRTPLLENELEGAIYLAKPYENPFSNLTTIYVAIEDEETGIVTKLAGRVSLDSQTGQLTTTFSENPELPVEDFSLHFFNGAGAALTTPLACGTKTTTSDLTPWSTPEGADATPSSSFAIGVAASGSGCPASESAAPDDPSFSAGTVAPAAGSFSPFLFKLTRADGSQHITGIDTTLPKGLLGKLASIPYCSDGAIALAKSREAPEHGKAEKASPSCPAASEVGTVTVGAGAGPTPFYATGHAYLAGPYKGAPLSLAIITPAVAGPFDLGNVVTRVALNVEPFSAQINAVSDPLPTILAGIPLDIRSIALRLDRPGFTLNPTSCEAKAITGSATTQAGQAASLNNHFQVGGCSSLAFKPKLSLSLKGATKRTGHPALKAVLNYPKGSGYANIAGAQVSLPHSEFLDQGNIGTVCTQPQLKAQACPAKSIYGKAKAWTPLLDKPLEGNVYLGAGFGHKLPDLVAELNGQIRVLLHGKIDTDKSKGIRNTFELLPDAPVERFVLELKGGKKFGLLENSEDICRKKQTANVRFTAQNGKIKKLTSKIGNSCKGAAKSKVKGKGKGKGKHSAGGKKHSK
jgi:hypothetical protein